MKTQNSQPGIAPSFKKTLSGYFRPLRRRRLHAENMGYAAIPGSSAETTVLQFWKARLFMYYLQAIEIFYLINK